MNVLSKLSQPTFPFLIPTLHDVCPGRWEACRRILDRLDQEGIFPKVLLLVPNFRGLEPVDEADEGFIEWILHSAGDNEICLHGYEHLAREVPHSPVRRLMATFYTNKEGEFYDLSQGEAEERIGRGIQRLRRIGLAPEGFIAPAWLLGEEALNAVAEAGFLYTVRLGCIEVIHPDRHKIKAPTLCYSVRSRWRRTISGLWNPFLMEWHRTSPVVRVAIHPVDIEYPEFFEQIIRLLKSAAAQRRIGTYQDFLKMLDLSGEIRC